MSWEWEYKPNSGKRAQSGNVVKKVSAGWLKTYCSLSLQPYNFLEGIILPLFNRHLHNTRLSVFYTTPYVLHQIFILQSSFLGEEVSKGQINLKRLY